MFYVRQVSGQFRTLMTAGAMLPDKGVNSDEIDHVGLRHAYVGGFIRPSMGTK
jgi:hypothetical protein